MVEASKSDKGPKGDKVKGRTDKDKGFKCGPIGPGPTYKLPPVIGYVGHDVTRHRNPAFSMGKKPSSKKNALAANAPMYNVGKVNRFGKYHSPAFSLLKRFPPRTIKKFGPGPAAYNTLNMKDFSKPTAPYATIKSRPRIPDKSIGPGPGAYHPKPPPLKAIKMKFRHPENKKSVGPGPGAYLPKPNTKKPQYAKIIGRPRPDKPKGGPGPAYFPKYNGRKIPSFTFGVKHSDCVGVYAVHKEDSHISVC